MVSRTHENAYPDWLTRIDWVDRKVYRAVVNFSSRDNRTVMVRDVVAELNAGSAGLSQNSIDESLHRLALIGYLKESWPLRGGSSLPLYVLRDRVALHHT